MPLRGPRTKLDDRAWLAFDRSWFKSRREKLLRLLNGPFRLPIRFLLGVDDSRPVCDIGPWWYTVSDGPNLVAVIRTHWKHSKRLYYSLKPLWWLLHSADQVFKWLGAHELSFGYDTLVVYPDPHPETNTVDGVVAALNAILGWYDIRTAYQGNYQNDSSSVSFLKVKAHLATNYWTDLSRGIFLFDTSVLGEGAQIQSATFSIYGYAKSNTFSSPSGLVLVSSNPQYNTMVTAGDYNYQRYGSVPFASISYSGYSTGAYNNLALNSSGINAINKTGITKFGLRFSWDVYDNPTWQSDAYTQYEFYTADQTGYTQDPKLTVVYTAPPVLKTDSEYGYLTASESPTAEGYATAEETGLVSATESALLIFPQQEASDQQAISAVEDDQVYLASTLLGDDSSSIVSVESQELTQISYVERLSWDSGSLYATEGSSLSKYRSLPGSSIRPGNWYVSI